MVRYAEPGVVEWVESGGGPLIAVPETVLPFWAGADGEETASDYDRACEVDGHVGLLPVGDCTALVLGDEPASTAYLPDRGLFVRWCAGNSEDELLASVPVAVDTAEWEPEVLWEVPGAVLLLMRRGPGRTLRGANGFGWVWSRGATRFGRLGCSRVLKRGWVGSDAVACA